MATPLNELESSVAAPPDAAAQSEQGSAGDRHLQPVASFGSSQLGSGFDIGLTNQGLTQDWLRVRMHSGSASDWAPLLNSGLPVELTPEVLEERVEDDGSKISVDELTRRFLTQEELAGRSLIGASVPGAAGDGESVDLGLNLVRSLLDHEMDRELALTALSHTIEIREFLLRLTASDHVEDYEMVIHAKSNRRSAAAASGKADGAREKVISSAERDHIAGTNDGSTIDNLKEFILEFLVDVRTIFFFGGSLLLILLLSFAVSRWSSA